MNKENIDPASRQFQTFREHFMSAKASAAAGYLSKTQWLRIGRQVVHVEHPVLCAAKIWRTYHPDEDDIILAYNALNEYVVTNAKYDAEVGSLGCWPVFQESQTICMVDQDHEQSSEVEFNLIVSNVDCSLQEETNTESTSINTLNSSSLTTSSSLPSYDGRNAVEISSKSSKKQGLARDCTDSRLLRTTSPCKDKSDSKSGVQVYFPEDFDWDKHPAIQKYRSSFLWFAHTLYERRFLNCDGTIYGKDDYITIKSEYARRIDPRFRQLIRLLLDLQIIERDCFQPNVKSYGYRFTEPLLRHAKRIRIPLNDPRIAKKIDEHRKQQVTKRTDRWLRSHLFRIGLSEVDSSFLATVAISSAKENGGRIDDKLDAYNFILDRIALREHLWSSDDQGRCYTLITNLKRELRSLLRVDGRPLQQIDISNSQLTFLALEMKRNGVECSRYFDLCEQGVLYEEVAAHAKTTRTAVKKAITQLALFSPNNARCQKSKIKRTFDRLFPEAASFLLEAKAVPEGHSRLAKTLQAAEADLIINRVCGRLRREDQVSFVSPIHDCLIFLPEDAIRVQTAMEEEFAKLGVSPRLKVKNL